ncbi:MAG: cytochrome c biogenesis protein CcdA [Spirochaetia bacterium]
MNLIAAAFTTVTGWFEGSIAIAIGAAFLWGVCSVVLSPCHVASVPLAIGYVNAKGWVPPKSALFLSLAFALGILVTIALVGGITAALGRMLGDVGALKYVVAAVFAVVGLWLIGIIRLPQLTMRRNDRLRGRGPAGAFGLGLVFGLALGPCSFGFMMPLLAVAFRHAATRPVAAAGLLGSYALGHTGVIIVAGTFANLVQRWLDWNERSVGTKVARIVCGVLVILAGIVMVVT